MVKGMLEEVLAPTLVLPRRPQIAVLLPKRKVTSHLVTDLGPPHPQQSVVAPSLIEGHEVVVVGVVVGVDEVDEDRPEVRIFS